MKKIVKKTVPFLTAAALFAVPVWSSAELIRTEIVSAENSAESGDVITLEIGEVTGEAGTKVKLPVYAKNIGHGFSAFQFDYEMDSSFTVTRVLKGDISGSWTVGKAGRTLQFLEADGMNVESEGKVGRIEIDIPAGTPDGTYEVSISNFEGSCVDSDTKKQLKLSGGNFSGVSGKIIIGNGGSGNDPAPSPSPSAEAPSPSPSPSPSVASSPSAKPSPSAKTSPSVKTSPSANTSPSAKATVTPSAKASSSPSANVKTSPSANTSASPASGNTAAPSAGSSASPAAVPSDAQVLPTEDAGSDVNANQNSAADAGQTPENSGNSRVSDANEASLSENDEKASELTSENKKDADEKPVSKKITVAAIIGSCVAVLLVLLLVFRHD